MARAGSSQPETPATVVGRLGDQSARLSAILAILGLGVYVVLRIAYTIFYNRFGLTPDDLGLGYIDLIVESAIGTVLVLGAVGVAVALVALLFVGAIASGHESAVYGSWYTLILLVGVSVLYASHVPAIFVPLTAIAILPCSILIGVGLRTVSAGLAGNSNRRWRAGVTAIALTVVIAAVAALVLKARRDETRIATGHPAAFTMLGLPITSWGAEDASITWTIASPDTRLVALATRCLLYFGQSGGTALFYDPDSHHVIRINVAEIIIDTRALGGCRH